MRSRLGNSTSRIEDLDVELNEVSQAWINSLPSKFRIDEYPLHKVASFYEQNRRREAKSSDIIKLAEDADVDNNTKNFIMELEKNPSEFEPYEAANYLKKCSFGLQSDPLQNKRSIHNVMFNFIKTYEKADSTNIDEKYYGIYPEVLLRAIIEDWIDDSRVPSYILESLYEQYNEYRNELKESSQKMRSILEDEAEETIQEAKNKTGIDSEEDTGLKDENSRIAEATSEDLVNATLDDDDELYQALKNSGFSVLD